MELPTSSADQELLKQAHGADVLTSVEIDALKNKAERTTVNRLKFFFNLREGWLLRRVARHHYTARINPTRCALCAGNIKGALRPLTNTKCTTCCVPLCRTPREGELGLSCFDEWHQKDLLIRRVYYSGPTKSKNAEDQRSANNVDDRDGEKPVPSAAVDALRQRRNAEEKAAALAAAADDEADHIVRGWARKRDLPDLLIGLSAVIPASRTWRCALCTSSEEEEIRKYYRRALLLIHPDRLAGVACTALELVVAKKAFVVLQDALCSYKQAGRRRKSRRTHL